MTCSVLKCRFDRWQPLELGHSMFSVSVPLSHQLHCVLMYLFMVFTKSRMLEGQKMKTSTVSSEDLQQVCRARWNVCLFVPTLSLPPPPPPPPSSSTSPQPCLSLPGVWSSASWCAITYGALQHFQVSSPEHCYESISTRGKGNALWFDLLSFTFVKLLGTHLFLYISTFIKCLL